MNPRCPTECLTVAESERLRDLVRLRGENVALSAVGMRSAEALYKAAAGLPVSRLTAQVIRRSLEQL